MNRRSFLRGLFTPLLLEVARHLPIPALPAVAASPAPKPAHWNIAFGESIYGGFPLTQESIERLKREFSNVLIYGTPFPTPEEVRTVRDATLKDAAGKAALDEMITTWKGPRSRLDRFLEGVGRLVGDRLPQ
jgi:hypothetical protein